MKKTSILFFAFSFVFMATSTGSPAAGDRVEPVHVEWLKAAGKQVTVLDLRGEEAYHQGTIPGALLATSLPDAANELADNIQSGKMNGPVILLMNEPVEQKLLSSWQKILLGAGYQVKLLDGGMKAWRAAGYEVSAPEAHYTKPGSVPFVVPLGLCERKEPVQKYR